MAKHTKKPPGLGIFLAALRWQESGSPAGNYREGNGQGAYQIIQSNWPTWAAEYADYKTTDPNASDAPVAVQNKVAEGKVSDYYYGAGEQNWRLVARIWNGGSPNAVPNPALGAGATTDTYATEVLDKVKSLEAKGGTYPIDTSAGGTGANTPTLTPTGGKAAGCQHSVSGPGLFGLKTGTICLDKVVAAGAMATGGVLILSGVVVILVAGFRASGAGKAAKLIPGVGGVVAKAATAPKRRRVRQETEANQAIKRQAPSRQAASQRATEARRQEAHSAAQARARTQHRRAGTAAAQKVRHREELQADRRQAASTRRVSARTPRGRSYPGIGHEPYPPRRRTPAPALPDNPPF